MATSIERLTAKVDADPAAAIAALEALSLAVDKTARDRDANIKVNVDESAAQRATGVFDALGLSMDRAGNSATRNGASLSGLSMAAHTTSAGMQALSFAISGLQLGSLYTMAGAAAGGLSGLAAAAAGAVGALAPLSGLLATIPVGLGAIVGGVGSTILGFGGVGQAVKAMGTAATQASRSVGGTGSAMRAATDSASAMQQATRNAAMDARALRDAKYGLRDALEAVKDAQHGVSEAHRGVQQAQQALKEATLGVADAQDTLKESTEGVADAQNDLKEATADVDEARKQAALDIRNYARAAEDAVWREEDAVDRLRRAQENLTAVQNRTSKSTTTLSKQTDDFTGKVYEVARVSADAVDSSESEADAKRDVTRAERELKRAREDNAEAQRVSNEAQREGIDGSDRVVSALERVKDAHEGVEDAQKRVVDAQRGVVAANQRVAESQQGIVDAQRRVVLAQRALRNANENVVRAQERVKDASQKAADGVKQAGVDMAGGFAAPTAASFALQDAMAGLSPAGRRFAKFLYNEFLPAMKTVQHAAQEGLLPGVERGLRSFLTVLPMVRKHVFNFAKAVGDAFADLMAHLVSPKVIAKVDQMFTGMFEVLAGSTDKAGNKMAGLLDLLIPLADFFIALNNAATPLTKLLVNDMVTSLTKTADAMGTVAGQERLIDFFDKTYKFGSLWMDVLRPLGGLLWNVGRAASPLAEWMLKSFADNLTNLNKEVGSVTGQNKLKAWFEDMKPVLSEMSGLISDVFDVLFTSGSGGEDSGFVRIIQSMRENVVPAFGDLMATLSESDFGPKFMEFVGNVVWGIEQLVKNDGPLTWVITQFNNLFDFFKDMDEKSGGKSTQWILGLVAALGAAKIGRGLANSISKNVLSPIRSIGGVAKKAPGKIGGMATKMKSAWMSARIAAMYAADFAKMVATTIVSTGKIVARWTWFAITSAAHAIKTFVVWAVQSSIALGKMVLNVVVATAKVVARWVWLGVMSAFHAGKTFGVWAIQATIAMGKALLTMIVTSAQIVAKWVWMGVQSLIQAGRMAFAWVVAMGPIGWVIAGIVGLGLLIYANWDKIIKWTKEMWPKVWKKITDTFNSIIGWVKKNWPTIIAFLTGPVGIAVRWVVKHWDKIKEGFQKVIDKVKTGWKNFWDLMTNPNMSIGEKLAALWNGLKTGFKSTINTVIRWWNGLSFKIPSIGIGKAKTKAYTVNVPDIPELRQFGGPVEGGKSYIVGEKRPEMLTLPEGSGGRIAAAVPRPMQSTAQGITEEQLDRILQRILEKAKPDVDMEVNMNEHADPTILSREIAWALR